MDRIEVEGRAAVVAEMSPAAVLAAHRSRLRGVDPLLPESGPVPEAAPGDTPLTAPGAVAVERRVVIDPRDLQATWGALDQRWLVARVADPAAMAVHQALDDAGISATLLHYSALNPLSAPFWHRSGYRPLRTRWQVSPAH